MILFKDINKGDVLFEACYGTNIVFKVKTQPEKNGDQWTFVGELNHKEINFLQTEGCTHYGPDLYRLSKEDESAYVQSD